MTAATDSAFDSGNGRDRQASATVVAVLPNELFRLRLEDGSERVAHVAGDLRKGFTRLLPGDLVRIEVSPLDPTKARMLARLAPPRR
jgi:translation initiation factor IF-1